MICSTIYDVIIYWYMSMEGDHAGSKNDARDIKVNS